MSPNSRGLLESLAARGRATTLLVAAALLGGTVAAGTWSAVESYYLKLLNCTRTGGWVTSTGACKAGSNGTKPLWMDAGIQTKLARPYAKGLATTGACSHTADGTFVQRLARAGYSGYTRAGENVGCGNGETLAAIGRAHRAGLAGSDIPPAIIPAYRRRPPGG